MSGRLSLMRCGDCGVTQGNLHEFGCDQELCPCCGRQLLSCPCLYEWLAAKRGVAVSKVEKQPNRKDTGAFLQFIEEEGRIPFQAPRAGKAWKGKAASPKKQLLALLLKTLEGPQEQCANPEIVNYSKVSLTGFGDLSLRSYPGYIGRDPDTGEKVEVPDSLQLIFNPDPSFASLQGENAVSEVKGVDQKRVDNLLKACNELTAKLQAGEKLAELPGIGVARVFKKEFCAKCACRSEICRI